MQAIRAIAIGARLNTPEDLGIDSSKLSSFSHSNFSVTEDGTAKLFVGNIGTKRKQVIENGYFGVLNKTKELARSHGAKTLHIESDSFSPKLKKALNRSSINGIETIKVPSKGLDPNGFNYIQRATIPLD